MERNYWQRMRRRRMSRRAILSASARAGVGAAGLVLVGCGDDDDDDDEGQAAAQADQQAEAADRQEQAAEDQAEDQADEPAGSEEEPPSSQAALVRAAIGSEPTTTDPHQLIGGVDTFYLFQMFNQLYEWGHDGSLTDALAESYEVAPDGSTITFNLRPGVMFHNGLPVTASDVVYSFSRHMAEENKVAKTGFATVESVTAVDEQTVVYTMAQPDAGFIEGGFGGLYVVPQAYLDDVGPEEFARNPVGTGPYMLSRLDIGTGARFQAFNDYFRGAPAFAEAEFKIIPEGTGRINALIVGDADIAAALPPEQVESVEGEDGLDVVIQIANTDTYYAIPANREYDAPETEQLQAFADPRVRQALNYAVDRFSMAEVLYPGGLAQPYSVTNATQPFHIDRIYPYDTSMAVELLDAAGYPDLSLNLYHLLGGRLPGLGPYGAAVASNLRDAGIDVTETPEEYNAWLSRLRVDSPPFPNDGIILSWASTAGYTNPFQGIDSKWICAARYGHYCNEEWEAKVAAARMEFDAETRNAMIRDFLNDMYEDAPALWTVLLHDAYAFRTDTIARWTPRIGANPVLRLEDLVAA